MPCESRRMGECLERCLGAKKSWLQRSQMFIEPLLTVSLAVPAERNVFGHDCSNRARFAPLERGRILLESCFYKHFVPTGPGR